MPSKRLVWAPCMEMRLLLEVRAQKPYGKEHSAATRVWGNVAGAIIAATAAEENMSVIVSAHAAC